LTIGDSSFDKFEAFFELLVILLIVFVDEFLEFLRSVLNLSFDDKVAVSFEGRSLDQDNVNKISFFKGLKNLVVGLFQNIDAPSLILIETQFSDGLACLYCLFGQLEKLEAIILS
jgi:hypothetical protein